MGLAPYNPFMGQIIKTNAGQIAVDHAFLAHYVIPAADADAAAADYVLVSTVLGAAPTEYLPAAMAAQPPTPRVLSVTGNQVGVAGNVVIDGTDAAGNVIQDTIIAAGAGTIIGVKAFATVTKITLPALVGAGDEISVGISDYFGIPYLLPNANRVLLIENGGVATTVAVASNFSATVLADNFIDPTAALAGAQIDVFLIV